MVPKIECRGLWKVFGTRSAEAMMAIKSETVGREEIRERFGCIPAVADVSFDVVHGEIFCVMGLSGSGKSTVVRHINRLIEPTSGQVFIDGRDISELKPKELRQLRAAKIGMVFQDRGLLPHRNVRDNVSFPLELRGVEQESRNGVAEEALQMVHLTGWGDLMPDELSGGMQQRVGIARAIAANPDILLMDEPFSALDPLIRRELQAQFLELSKVLNKTTIFITHDLDEAIRLGARIAIMKDGSIVQVGTPEEILTRPADRYVEDFVRGISRLEAVKARSVMEPVEACTSASGGTAEDHPEAPAEADLAQLIDIMIKGRSPVWVVDAGKRVGLVTIEALLRGIRGTPTGGSEPHV